MTIRDHGIAALGVGVGLGCAAFLSTLTAFIANTWQSHTIAWWSIRAAGYLVLIGAIVALVGWLHIIQCDRGRK